MSWRQKNQGHPSNTDFKSSSLSNVTKNKLYPTIENSTFFLVSKCSSIEREN